MAHESFEKEELAALLNRDFIAIKVDREERPDVDHIYMMVCQALTGQGGWPLTIIMDAEKRPFYAATYLPLNSRGGMPGLMQLLPRIIELWTRERDSLLQSAEQISRFIHQGDQNEGAGQEITVDHLKQTYQQFLQAFDAEWGGFGSAPKFPTPHNLLFLLRYFYFQKEKKALDMVEKTLQHMYRGGIYDHIGYGFARYSTDRQWLVPHFEKMLYDNALLAMAYLETYQLTGNHFYAQVAREIFSYVLRDMTDPEGGFYSAEDADSEGEEGKFYLWTREQIKEVLGDKAEAYARSFDISEQGNFEGKNIPNLRKNQHFTKQRETFEKERQALFDQREKRVKPLKDDKVLTAWNGLMMAAFSMGARILKEDVYLRAAARAADFVMAKLRRPDGRLLARYREGKTDYLAYAADYAYLIWGLIELYEAGFDTKHLLWALELNDDLIKYFWDKRKGGLFFYGLDGEPLLTHPKEHYDGAMPSDNAVATLNFLRLARLTGNTDLEDKANQAMALFAGNIQEQPTAHAFWLMGASFKLFPAREVVIASSPDSIETFEIMEHFHSQFNPNTTLILKAEEDDTLLEEKAVYLHDMHRIDGQITAYICENFSCHKPLVGMNEILQAAHQP